MRRHEEEQGARRDCLREQPRLLQHCVRTDEQRRAGCQCMEELPLGHAKDVPAGRGEAQRTTSADCLRRVLIMEWVPIAQDVLCLEGNHVICKEGVDATQPANAPEQWPVCHDHTLGFAG